MGNWQATFLGLKQLPRELTAFEIEAFFTFTLAERQLIEDRRRPALKLGLALQIGFLRMCGRLLDAVRYCSHPSVSGSTCRPVSATWTMRFSDSSWSIKGIGSLSASICSA